MQNTSLKNVQPSSKGQIKLYIQWEGGMYDISILTLGKKLFTVAARNICLQTG